MYEKDPSGFNEALGLARSAALEHIRAPHRSPEHTPASDDSEQGSAGQLANDPKFSEGQEAGSERSLGEKINNIFWIGLVLLTCIIQSLMRGCSLNYWSADRSD